MSRKECGFAEFCGFARGISISGEGDSPARAVLLVWEVVTWDVKIAALLSCVVNDP